ncbi:phytanoyl-CoA dioxygenase family protein [Actinoallomurus iriomotensis]|uniref:Protein involved in biosynthesis of mitomycin antibiotics/polyketide fumonisin n=1 Tax=Actinoallomurus iriomotensis TaxID=478107 RepID=A0A9W6VY22_9ACTN|nr:phytanoyl-CoA dioxygenase family protein [Actinoallomurus iriomotensis]GLY82416.1 protein involved in biosynthesis of mitomycin antibiotics/polyketide fumonisin [Actinoallomurus iriomotensis]
MSDFGKEVFEREGYLVARGVFDAGEVDRLRDHYMTLRRRGPHPHDLAGVRVEGHDPLRRYPRMAQMHRWDEVSLRWLLDSRLRERLTALVGEAPYAVQSMLYFKPPGSRGQALHQDNFYLRADPGTCVAAWMALDPTDEENGCMMVVPGSQNWPILCTAKADTRVSFTDVTVPVPDEHPSRPVRMEPGDVLFFNGSLVHGSRPNTSDDRFRRALIGHYVQAEARKVAKYFHPALRMDGTPLELEVSEGGGLCGEWTDAEGTPAIAMTGYQTITRKHE